MPTNLQKLVYLQCHHPAICKLADDHYHLTWCDVLWRFDGDGVGNNSHSSYGADNRALDNAYQWAVGGGDPQPVDYPPSEKG